MKRIEFGVEQGRKLLEVVDKGLTNGLGLPEPGKMCVEAAVCYALGLPHDDNPPCVAAAVRSFKISLNDSNWPSKKARARGLRRLAVAQLGSAGVVRNGRFARALVRAILADASFGALSEVNWREETVAERLRKALKNNAHWTEFTYVVSHLPRSHKELSRMAEIGLSVLRKMKSPGVAVLDALEAEAR